LRLVARGHVPKRVGGLVGPAGPTSSRDFKSLVCPTCLKAPSTPQSEFPRLSNQRPSAVVIMLTTMLAADVMFAITMIIVAVLR
jgi:hypothetical protein